MAYEFLGQNDNYKVLELQRRNVVSLLEPSQSGLVGYPDEKTVHNSKVFATYERYTDIVLKGSEPQPIYVELKSYPAHYNKTENYYKTARKTTIENKFPIWEKIKKSDESGTTVHRQVIFDAVLSSSHPNFVEERNETVASDFRWYFQDWPLTSPNKRHQDIRDNGNSLAKVEISTMPGTTAFAYMREELLSQLGTGLDSKKFVTWNIGRDDSHGNMYSKLRSLGDGGLRSRIKVFSLTGILGMEAVDGADDEISREELLVMFKEGIGLEEEDIDIINDAEKYQEKVLEHLTALKDQIAEELDALPGIDSEEVKEVYEEILKELQEKRSLLDEIETEVIDDLAKLFPDFGSTSCH